MINCLLRYLTFSSLLFTSTLSFGQVIGSHDNSDMIPAEAKASTLSTGIVSGDVNLFNGDYNMSMSLGSVSSPGGLSFDLGMSYSSTYTAGTSPLVASGIPYGEGWNLSIPTISVSNAAYFAFTEEEEHIKVHNGTGPTDTQPNGLDTNYYDQITGTTNGDLYWYSPTVNIPGYVNGKAIFKRLEDNGQMAVFVLNKFDKYVELRFNGSWWEVALDNGLIYELSTAMVAYRTPNNQKVLNYDSFDVQLPNNEVANTHNTDDYGNSADMVKNSIEPKEEVSVWYCTEIRNKNIEHQFIRFEYEKFGAFNFFKEYGQQMLDYQIGLKLYDLVSSTPGGFNHDFTAYRDILLTKITATVLETEIEVLDLNYQSAQMSHPSLIGVNMLDHSDIDVFRKDSLYSYKVIYGEGTGNNDNFSYEWNRYLHGKTNEITGAINRDITGTNPYLMKEYGVDKYLRQINQGGANSLPFNHGFLETKRIPSSDIISGDIYEVKAKIIDLNNESNIFGNGTIDISIVTGGYDVSSNLQGELVGSPISSILDDNSSSDRYLSEKYDKTRNEQIYSTFNNAIKWQLNTTSTSITTSNYFVMPNIPTSNQGINVQIGPGGADHNYAKAASLQGSINPIGIAIDGNTPSAYNSYAHRIQQSIQPYGHVPSNFGIGLPWSMVLPLYAPSMGGFYEDTSGARVPRKSSFSKFWWNDSNTTPYWDSEPTKFNEDVRLKEFELIRYSKNPYMLSHVKKYKLNGEVSGQSDSGMVLIKQKDFAYEIDESFIYENYDYLNISKMDSLGDINNDGKIHWANIRLHPQESISQTQYVYTLTNIKEMPIGHFEDSTFIIPSTTNYVETDLEYDWFGMPIEENWIRNVEGNKVVTDSIRLNPGRKTRVLTKITNPLGGEDHIEYYPGASKTTLVNTSGNNTQQNILSTYVKKSYISGYASVVHPSVKSIIRNKDIITPNSITINNLLESRTDYYYDTTKLIWETEDIHLPEHFRHAYQIDYQKGFENVAVVNSELATGEQNYSKHYFGGNVNTTHYDPILDSIIKDHSTLEEYLFFGKLLKTEHYNTQNVLESSTTYTYDYTLAHKNAVERASIYRNNMIDPHSDFERFSGTSAGYHDYEYGDYYRGDTYQTNEIVNGVLNHEIIGKRERIGCVIPKFYQDLQALNDARFFRSYFIKLDSKSKKNYDETCVKSQGTVPITYNDDFSVTEDPFGPAPTNPKPPTQTYDDGLKELISATVNHGGDIVDTIIGISPLSDSVISHVLYIEEPLSNEVIHDILLYQNPLSDAFLFSIFDNTQNLRPDQVISIFKNQPYITDAVQKHAISNFELSQNSILTEVLNHNAYLSDEVLETLFNESGFPEVVINDVLLHQPQLNLTTLNNILENGSEVEAFNVVDILATQAYLSDSIFINVLANNSLADKDKSDILTRSASYPTSDAIVDDFLDLELQEIDYLNIGTASPRVLSNTTTIKIQGRVPEAPFEVFQMAQLSFAGYEQYCQTPTICSNDYIETKEDYTYFEANHDGTTLAEGYKKLLGLENVVGKNVTAAQSGLDHDILLQNIQLKHEPSWQLHSIKSYSPDYPEAFSQKEYYYYYDELNRHDRHIEYYDLEGDSPIEYLDGFGTTYPGVTYLHNNYTDFMANEILYGQVPLSDGGRCSQRNFLRNIPFQETTISKNNSDDVPINKSVYYHYDTKVYKGGTYYDKITKNYSGVNCDSLTNSINCGYNIIGYVAHAYSVTDVDVLIDLPEGYCAYELDVFGGPIYFVKTGFDFSNCSQMQSMCDSIRLIGCNDGTVDSDGPQGFVNLEREFQGTQISLKDVILQIDTIPSTSTEWAERLDQTNNYIAFFKVGGQDEHGLWEDDMVFPFDTLAIRTIDSLNHYGQVALEHDQSGIYTKYNYDLPSRIWNVNSNASLGCGALGSYSSYLSTNIGMPTSIIVGYGRTDSLKTDYEYYPNYRLKSITNPNQLTVNYQYDDYGRLHKAYENNRLISENRYHYWDRDPNDDYEARSNQNYTESFAFNDTVITPNTYNGVHTKSFTDVYGREIQTLTAIENDKVLLKSPTTIYDNWNRAIQTLKPSLTTSASAIPMDFGIVTGGDYQAFLYENNTKGRLLRSAAYGINQIQNTHTVKQSYKIVNDIVLACELGLSANELVWQIGSSLTNNLKFYQSMIEDEDGKTMTTYTNPLGQKVATLQYGQNLDDDIVTLFGYDSYGNLNKVVNPKKQISTYQYNILGQLYKQTTPDAGDTKYMYNKQGKVALKLTENGQKGAILDADIEESFYTAYIYDDYARLLNQKVVKFNKTFVGGGHIVNYNEVNLLMYQDSIHAADIDNEPILETFPTKQNYLNYHFSNNSTYNWMAQINIVYPPNLSAGSIWARDVPIDDLLEQVYFEKELKYGHNNVNYTLGKLNQQVNYDSEGRIIQVTQLTYDENGNLLSEETEFNPSGKNTILQAYANPNKTVESKIFYTDYNYQRALGETSVDIGNDGAIDFQYHHSYDDWGNLDSVFFNYRNNADFKTLVASYKYDLTTGQNLDTEHHFIKSCSGSLTPVTAQIINKAYDMRNRLISQNSGLLNYNLYYDNQVPVNFNGETVNSSQNWNGNINGMSMNYLSGQASNALSFNSVFSDKTVYGYEYDLLNRLIEADAIVGDVVNNSVQPEAYSVGDVFYQFDKIGNFTNVQREKQEEVTGQFVSDEWAYQYTPNTNRLTTASGSNGTTTRQYTYDANGNLLSDNIRELDTILYYRDNFPVQITKPDESIDYLYGVDDIRMYKKVDELSPVSTATEEYYLKNIGVYDMVNDTWTYYVNGLTREAKIKPDANFGQTPDQIYNTHISNHPITPSTAKKLGLSFYISDYLGNTRIVYKPIYNCEENRREDINEYMADYYPYGKILREFVSNGDREKYLTTQHERDDETGLDYRGARFYDSDIGRFLSLDPLAMEYPSFSDYSYVAGNPIMFTDPTGMAIEGDYYGKSGTYLGSDGKDDDKVYSADSKNADGSFSNAVQLMDADGTSMSHNDFKKSAGKIDNEGSGQMETRGIAHTSVNGAKQKGTSVYKFLVSKSTAGSKTISTSDNSAGANEARAGLIHALSRGIDPTNGAIRWDGTDFLAWGLNRPAKAGGGVHPKFKSGVEFTIQQYSAFLNAQLAKYPSGKVSYQSAYGATSKLPAAVFTNNDYWNVSNGNFSYPGSNGKVKYKARAVIGETIFWGLK